jgi:DNA-binding NtrC family response regulator
MIKKKNLHLVDDEMIIHDIFKRIFESQEYELIISDSKELAIKNHSKDIDVVIMDLMIPGTSGIEIFKEIKKNDPEVKAIFLTAFGTIKSAIEAIKLGAVDYLQKPFNNMEIKHKIERIIKERRMELENKQLKTVLNERYSFKNIIGKSKPFTKALSLIETVAESDSTILITGESGTGKELFAKAIYQNSLRKNRPFYAFNSSNVPVNLFESILFGYKKGSFTGAYKDKKGIFEEYHMGTIFIDEISNVDPETQKKLLRVLQEKEIQPIGSNKLLTVDVRIIAATNENLKTKVAAGEFREDLYYRLNVINIEIPPLKIRKDDIPLLVNHFIKKHAGRNNKVIFGYTNKFLQYLLDYNWPGNVRELENTLIRAIVLSKGEQLNESLISPDIINTSKSNIYKTGKSYYHKIEEFKKELIIQALNNNSWIQKKAALELEIKPSTLSEQMKRLNISK